MKWAKVTSRKGLSAWTPSHERRRAGIATGACQSQQERSQWLVASNAGVSAASESVGLSLSATTWHHLPVGGWQQ